MNTYHISYSCYSRRMRILLNEKNSISSGSTILQYMNEPFYIWAAKILDLLYREIEDDYQLIFEGRPEEIEIMSHLAQQYSHCISFEARTPIIAASLQNRMIGLSTIMTEDNIAAKDVISIEAFFAVDSNNASHWGGYIDELEIRNQYCKVDFSWSEYIKEQKLPDADTVFYIFEDHERARDFLNDSQSVGKYSFILVKGNNNRFTGLKGNKYIYEFTEDKFFDTVFNCFLLFPLADVFSKYVSSLTRNIKEENIRNKLRVLVSEKPVALVKTEEEIELGCSIPIRIEMVPENAPVPELYFEYQLPGIVECSQQRVYGIKTGQTKVLVYEKGEVEPLKELTFVVIERNRVSTVNLSDYTLDMGVGDKYQMSCECFPENADNLDKLKWYSDKDDIASVNSNGEIIARGRGNCNIYCSVEKAFAQCSVTVKPYLEDIIISEEFSSGSITMQPGDRKNLGIKAVPADSHDGNILVNSSNYMVVNIDGDAICASGTGEADIYIENPGRRIVKKIHVSVVYKTKNEKKKRKGLFGLFGG